MSRLPAHDFGLAYEHSLSLKILHAVHENISSFEGFFCEQISVFGIYRIDMGSEMILTRPTSEGGF